MNQQPSNNSSAESKLTVPAIGILEHAPRAKEMGMNDFITKPFNPKELFEKIRFWVKQNV